MQLYLRATRAAMPTILAVCALSQPAAANGFTGPYIGVAGYYGWATVDATVERTGVGTATGTGQFRGPSIAGFAGYDWQINGQTVLGISADIGVAKFSKGSLLSGGGLGGANGVLSTVRARAGHMLGSRSMIYVTGGVAMLKDDVSGRLGGYGYELTGWVPGLAVGGGFETRSSIAGHPVRIGIEALYLDFNARHFEVTDRRATLEYSGWSLGARLGFELNRETVAP